MKKTKRMSEAVLQMPVKRRDATGKRKKERYAHLNAEFQRIARRVNKPLLLQYCGHLMRRVDSLEKTLMLGGIGGRRRRG